MGAYSFGFLKQKVAYQFPGGEIVPTNEFDDNSLWIAKYEHEDGFLYPPMGYQAVEGEAIPNTRRPEHLHQVPASHELRFQSNDDLRDPHRTDASIIMQLVAYLHGTCLQFEDWWFDARVPLGRHRIGCSHPTAEHFLSHSYETWRQWPDRERTRFVTILFMFNRAPSYEWDWEHFIAEYMVFDALYKTAVKLQMESNVNRHEKRLGHIIRTFGLQDNEALRKEFVRLRNDLFHETLWDSGTPGTARSDDAFMSPLHLRRLNQRLVLAVLGYNNDFMRSNWWTMGSFAFEKPPGS